MPGNAREYQEYQEMPRNAKECLGMPRNSKECQGMPGNARKCQGIPRNAKEYQRMPGNPRKSQEIPGNARQLQPMAGPAPLALEESPAHQQEHNWNVAEPGLSISCHTTQGWAENGAVPGAGAQANDRLWARNKAAP
ncbi:hypothetical protein TURU_153471 [Turdus rufiventris]|nr:hypothetical protein TURU_153471 [Turdus rufiventris]